MMLSNPFSTKFIRAGEIPFIFADGSSEPDVWETLKSNGMRGQIVGPHGTGKSTLLRQLTVRLEACDKVASVMAARLTAEDHCLPWGLGDIWRAPGDTVLVVDGFEQLAWLRRMMLLVVTGARRLGLVVTAHRQQIQLPLLLQTNSSASTLRAVVHCLLADQVPDAGDVEWIGDAELRQLLDTCDGSTREVLFRLFDRWESEIRSNSMPA